MIRQSSPQSWALISSLLRDTPRLLESVRARACVCVCLLENRGGVARCRSSLPLSLSAGGYSREKEADEGGVAHGKAATFVSSRLVLHLIRLCWQLRGRRLMEIRGPRVVAATVSTRDNHHEGGERRMREEEWEMSVVSGE